MSLRIYVRTKLTHMTNQFFSYLFIFFSLFSHLGKWFEDISQAIEIARNVSKCPNPNAIIIYLLYGVLQVYGVRYDD